MKTAKPLNKFWNRSSIFYKVRFALLLKNINQNKLEDISYNNYNSKKSIPKIYYDVNKDIFKENPESETDFDKAIHIATWLRNNIKGGKGLGVSSDKALEFMLAGGFGICSDFCQIFNNFCVINDIKVREWGLLNTEVEREGHSFNEIYASSRKQWILIDVAYGVYFTSKSKSGQTNPLSATEVFTYSKLGNEKKMVIYNDAYQAKSSVLKKYYYTENMQPFVVDKYRNKVYDYLLNNLKFLAIPFIHGIAILLNRSYVYGKIPLQAKEE